MNDACEAWVRERDDLCEAPAPFRIDRHFDTPLSACRAHLGALLAEAEHVAWPPRITWTGEGGKPARALVEGSREYGAWEKAFRAGDF